MRGDNGMGKEIPDKMIVDPRLREDDEEGGAGMTRMALGLPPKNNRSPKGTCYFRAGKGVRTLDIDLGKVALYQLSYSRESFPNLIKKRIL